MVEVRSAVEHMSQSAFSPSEADSEVVGDSIEVVFVNNQVATRDPGLGMKRGGERVAAAVVAW
jgi:hypothetical protein